MNKKELNDLIDRIVLTGPGGVDKIKKILKEIVNGDDGGSNSSSGSGCTCLSPMIVRGTVNDGEFTPSEDAPTWAEAYAHMLAGGLLYFIPLEDGEPHSVYIAVVAGVGEIDSGEFYWNNPDGVDELNPIRPDIPGGGMQ